MCEDMLQQQTPKVNVYSKWPILYLYRDGTKYVRNICYFVCFVCQHSQTSNRPPGQDLCHLIEEPIKYQ